jgi:hypothetical protein
LHSREDKKIGTGLNKAKSTREGEVIGADGKVRISAIYYPNIEPTEPR